jgi:outer membrane protein OmpA-like peptidoglycan-associated protein
LGAFARYNKFGDFGSAVVSSKARNAWGFGGRLGYFVSDRWEIELDGSHNPTDLDEYVPGQSSNGVYINPFHLRLNYNMPIGSRAQFILGAGPGLTMYNKIIDGSNLNVSGLVGVRAKIAGPLHFRADGTLDYEPSGSNRDGLETEARTTLGAQVGLSIVTGGSGCNRVDSVTISPTSVTLRPGQRQSFTATTWNCDRPMPAGSMVASGGGTMTGSEYVAGNTPGTYYVTASDAESGRTGRATVTVQAPPAPPPPPPAPAPTPPPPPPAPPRAMIVLQGVNFEFDRSNLTRAAQDTLRRVARDLVANPSVNVEVVGHTDWIGTNEYNMRLSRARAESVKTFLAAQGVAADRIATAWFGEERPVSTNETDAGRAANRRVEINRTNDDKN